MWCNSQRWHQTIISKGVDTLFYIVIDWTFFFASVTSHLFHQMGRCPITENDCLPLDQSELSIQPSLYSQVQFRYNIRQFHITNKQNDAYWPQSNGLSISTWTWSKQYEQCAVLARSQRGGFLRRKLNSTNIYGITLILFYTHSVTEMVDSLQLTCSFQWIHELLFVHELVDQSFFFFLDKGHGQGDSGRLEKGQGGHSQWTPETIFEQRLPFPSIYDYVIAWLWFRR